MSGETHEETMIRLQKTAKLYTRHLEISILEDAPWIVEVGALTVTTDADRQITLQNVMWPTQFTQKAVNTIMSCEFKDGDGNKVTPVAYSRAQWYRNQLASIKDTLKLFGY
jgi:hypothetical protein